MYRAVQRFAEWDSYATQSPARLNFERGYADDQPEKPGYLKIHQTAIQSDIIQKSQMCAPCHQVAVHAGIKLETVWEEWRASPAASS